MCDGYKNLRMKKYYVFILILVVNFCFAKQSKIDSLITLSNTTTEDSIKVIVSNQLSELLRYQNPDTALLFANKALILSQKNNWKEDEARALISVGTVHWQQGDYVSALDFYEKVLLVLENKKPSVILLSLYNGFGNTYKALGDHSLSLDYFFKSAGISESLGDEKGRAIALNNIGMIYSQQNDLDKALEYFEKSLEIKKTMGNERGYAYSLGNIGLTLMQNGALDEAEKYLNKVVEILEKMNDKQGLAFAYNGLGTIAKDRGELNLALDFHLKSLELKKEIGHKLGMCYSYENLGIVYIEKGNFKKAVEYCEKSYEAALSISLLEVEVGACECLTRAYEGVRDYRNALKYSKLHRFYSDSLINKQKIQESTKKELEYDFGKKLLADSISHHKEQEVKQAEIEKQKAQLQTKENQQYALFGGIALVLIFSGFMYNRYKITQKQKVIIEETNEELNQTNEELAAQRDEIENQKNKVEEAHKEITDSINYAKRIQEAILPPLSQIKKALPQSFVLYQPKDVVAGDFYWMEATSSVSPKGGENSPLGRSSGAIYIAAADCTGHGVPGAMVSVVCSNALTKAVLEDGIRDVGKILDRTREIVIDKLAKSSEMKDGMDISLACVDFDKMKLEWAGANNPLYLLRHSKEGTGKESTEIESSSFRADAGGVESEFSIEITKGDREPIGFTDHPTPFTTHAFDLQKGDTIYLFTDGYADQFGGNQGKKLGYKKFREKLIELSCIEIEQQKTELASFFLSWKGVEEQVDDVCVIGIKI